MLKNATKHLQRSGVWPTKNPPIGLPALDECPLAAGLVLAPDRHLAIAGRPHLQGPWVDCPLSTD